MNKTPPTTRRAIREAGEALSVSTKPTRIGHINGHHNTCCVVMEKGALTVLVATLSSGVKCERRKNTAESEAHEKETNCVYASSIVEASSKERPSLNHLTHKELLSSVGGGSKREGTDLLSLPVGPEENEDGGHNDTRDHDTEHAVLGKMSGFPL